MRAWLAALTLLFPLAMAQGAQDWSCQTTGSAHTVQANLSGVPAILRIPAYVTRPPILLWHGFGPPSSEADLAAALPLDEIPAIKIYLGLPLFGQRAPKAGEPTLRERQGKDYGLLLFGPAAIGAADEVPAVVQLLTQHGCLDPRDKVSLFGFSASGASVLTALADRKIEVSTAVLVNPATGLTSGVAALEKATGQPYVWTDQSKALAARSDASDRAWEIGAGKPPPAILIITGGADDVVSSDGPRALKAALEPVYRAAGQEDRLTLAELPGLGHDWTMPQSHAAVEALISGWFRRYP